MMMDACLIRSASSSPVQWVRTSLELLFIFNVEHHLKTVNGAYGSLNFCKCWCLTGCRPEQQMMYAGSKNKLVQTVELTKVSEPRVLTDLKSLKGLIFYTFLVLYLKSRCP